MRTLNFGQRVTNSDRSDSRGHFLCIDREPCDPNGGTDYFGRHMQIGRVVVRMDHENHLSPDAVETARMFVASYDMYYALQECIKLLPTTHPVRKRAEAALDRADNEPIPGEQ